MTNRKNLIVLAFVILFIVALACGGGGSNTGQQGDADKADQQPAQDAAAEEKPASIGQDVMVGDVRWKVLEAKDLGKELKSDNKFIKPKTTSGKFVLVRVEVENRKTEAATYAGINLADDKNRTFERYTEQFGYIPDDESCILEQLNPNISKTCSEIFELPADAKGIKAKLGDLELFGGKEALVDLGF